MKKFLALTILSALLLCLMGCGQPAKAPSEPTAGNILDGKRIIFIGNSHTYVGNVVTQVYNSRPEQEKRDNNQGFFYLLCLQQGAEVSVTNWTFSSHGLASIFGGTCTTKGDCKGLNHEEYLTDPYFDYVVIQPGVGQKSEENVAQDIAYIVDYFKKVNPKVQFALLGNASVYGNNKDGTTYPGITSYYKTLAEQGFIIADWGKLVNDLIRGEVAPEGSDMTYTKSSFIIKDGFHPNYLSGYLASLMLYCAITGESAADVSPALFQDPAMQIMVDSHLASSYENGNTDSNFKYALTVERELAMLHKLVDRYLVEKPYLQSGS